MLYDDVKNFSNTLRDFRAYPSISDRYAWEHVNEAWKEETIKAGEKFLGHSYAVLTATDFMEYSRTGNRVNFENKYFEKRRALNALVLAECVEDKGRFLDSIVNGIWQDAKNGLKYHIHVWSTAGKCGATEGVRSTENFKEAIKRLKKEFEAAGYQFKINMKDRGFSTSVVENVHISWYKFDK